MHNLRASPPSRQTILRDSARDFVHPSPMFDSRPMAADEVVVGCVTEDNPKYLGQALRLVQSIQWFGGELAQARLIVGAVEHIDPGARRALEALGAEVRIVPRFDSRNGSANRLQLLNELRDGIEKNIFMLDCDTLVVRDPLPLLRRDVFQSKIAPLPTVTHEVFERLFKHFHIDLPARTFTTGYTGTPTIPYFNAGVFTISADLAGRLVPEWRRFNALLAAEPALVAPCEKHLHQAALALALAVSGVPVEEMGPELNFQLNMTQFPAPPGYLDVDPFIIHYHELVDDDGLLLPCPFPRAQERIDRFHERFREERARSIARFSHEPVAQSSPRQIAVLGMHRSGTSLVARLLNSMGCYAGEDHEPPAPDLFNPTGYWEHRDVWALDEEILAALDASWLDPASVDLARLNDESRRTFVGRAREIVRTLDEHGSWMVKDPRLSILFPIWREVLDRPICVLVWREPAAVARSIERRDGLPFVLGLALWEEYTRAMLASTIAEPRVCVSYQDLVADPIQSVARLHAALVAAGAADLQLPPDDEIRSMIDPALDRHSSKSEGLLNRQQSELRDALRSGAALEWEAVPPVQRETRDLLSTYLRQQREIATLQKETAEREMLIEKETAEREMLIEAVFASRSWRLGFALTRLWRRLAPSSAETAVERWSRRRR
jgi:Uncharacterized protein conserved in bacteria